ncbi:uncharacterized protein LOC121421669 [Lytechinus variegatus]|uniref:uncharacterized protein LOC121421669 n=1 Tax=Lytechinus variegatus TaxID=7654 RepID=UPI001BB0ED53|nr:uncharacterized protein LOC121421669 [Lytechinus variegatus]
MATLLYILSFLSICVFASALDCYECQKCKSYAQYGLRSETCSPPLLAVPGFTDARCYKEINDNGEVFRGCTSVTKCTAREVVQKCSETKTTNCYICCDKPNCNSAPFTTVSMATLILSSAFAVVRLL